MTNFQRLLWFLGNSFRRLHWPPQKLRQYQEQKMRFILKYAYDYVPFYHQWFRRAGLHPSDIKGIGDLSRLPLIRKTELNREPSRSLISTEYLQKKLRVVRTSGSTGQPFQFSLSGREDDWRKSIYMRANISCGQKPTDRWLTITAPYHFRETTEIQRRLGIFAQTCVSVFGNIDEQIEQASAAKPDILDGYSGSILLLAREVERRGLDSIKPRIIFGTADLIDSVSMEHIERVFGAPFYDQFGCSELDRTAWQCPEKTGYHMDVDSVIIQFVDEDGHEVSPSERGEIVYTSLFNLAMPFIRYAVGDVGVPSNDECPCGRTLPLMEVIEGRKDSMLLLPDGKWLSPRSFTVALSMFKYYRFIERFRIIQKRTDVFKIYIKNKHDSIDEDEMKNELETYMNKLFNAGKYELKIETICVDDLPLDSDGKLKSVTSELKIQDSSIG